MHPNNSLSLVPVATVFLLSLLLQAGPQAAPDLAREQRLAEQTVDAILDGEPVDLVAGDHTFLGIFMEAGERPAKGAALILHGRGTHPDWTQVAAPLRTALPARGWTTLSLQMPVLAKDATYYDYVPVFPAAIPRIDAGIRFLRGKGYERIVLIAHSCGVHMAMARVEQHGTRNLAAFITVGMGATDYGQPMKKPFPFEQIQVPFLNVYGSEDYPAVKRLAGEMKQRLACMPAPSTQVGVPGANHYFDDADEELVAVIGAWLEKLPPGDSPR